MIASKTCADEDLARNKISNIHNWLQRHIGRKGHKLVGTRRNIESRKT